MGDIDTLHAMMAEHFKFVEGEVDSHKANVKAQTGAIEHRLVRIENAVVQKEECLTNSLKKAVDMAEMQHELQDTITELESKKLLELARTVHANCHPRAEMPMRELIRSLTGKWDLLDHLVKDKADKLNARLEEIRNHEKTVEELLNYVAEKKGELEIMTSSDDHNQLNQLSTLMGEQNMFASEVESRQPEIEEAVKIMKRTAPVAPPPSTPMTLPCPAASTPLELFPHLHPIYSLYHLQKVGLQRRIDKSGTGMVPRKLFIDGILASKFPTTEMEWQSGRRIRQRRWHDWLKNL
uniref:Uncharacterized protein n=1 Tax=Ditylenchus dipsaci TaxID=166011 RepID=A0A915ELJ5_9BILA